MLAAAAAGPERDLYLDTYLPDYPDMPAVSGRISAMDRIHYCPSVHQQHPSTDAISGRQALIDRNCGHVNVVVCESDYRALKQGDRALPPPPQWAYARR